MMKRGKDVRPGIVPDRPKEEFRPVDPDQAVVNLLSKGRTDLGKQRAIDFYLYFPKRGSARSAVRKLTEIGFTAKCLKGAKPGTWLCLAAKKVSPKVGNLVSIRRLMEQIAKDLGGVYDGWETQLSYEEAKGMPGVR